MMEKTMNDSHLDHIKIRGQLIEAYRQLPPLEQQIVQLFSVIYESIARTTFLECLNRLGSKDEKGKTFSAATLKPYLEKLMAVGLLLQESGQGPRCHPLIVEIATRDTIRAGTFENLVAVVEEKLPILSRWEQKTRDFKSYSQLIREVRLGLYRQDLVFIKKQFANYYQYNHPKNAVSLDQIFEEVFNNPFDADWFSTLGSDFYEPGLSSILFKSILSLSPADEAFELLRRNCSTNEKSCSDRLRLVLAEQELLRGNIREARATLESVSDEPIIEREGLYGWSSFLQGNNQEAIDRYQNALAMLKKNSGKRKIYFGKLEGLFLILALLKNGSPQHLEEAASYLEIIGENNHWLTLIYRTLAKVLAFEQGDLSQKDEIIKQGIPSQGEGNSLENFFRFLSLYWVDRDEAKKHASKVLRFHKEAKEAGYLWLAMETAELLSRLKSDSRSGKLTRAWQQEWGIQSIIDTVELREPWELSLTALSNLIQKAEVATKTESKRRLAWLITFYSDKNYLIQPREQSLNAKGIWSQGRPIALKRLAKTLAELGYLSEQDFQVCSHLEVQYLNYGLADYTFGKKAILALVGHPLVFWEDVPTIRVEIVKGEPELLVKKTQGARLILQMSPSPKEDKDIIVIKENPTRLKVIKIKPEHRRIAAILGKENRLEVPLAAHERVLAAINAVSGIVTVHSDIGGGLENVQEVPAQSKPHIHLLPAGDGLKAAILTRPFAEEGPYFHPGKGGETVITEINGKRLQTTRSLKEEKTLAQTAIDSCPVLSEIEPEDGEWLLENPQECLELLLQLQALGDRVILEWPQGEKLRVSHQASFANLRLNIERQRDWFAADGELHLDNQLVLDLQTLLELLEKTPGRFIPLADGQFLALTKEFRQRLDELRDFSEKNGRGRRFHPLATLALENVFDEVATLKSDQHWKKHLKRIKEMQELEPVLPSTLQAELRDYQVEGFRWLAQLAHWGVGACLADDMGLGKTIQALALILTRAATGPTLIIAPTSVCLNWFSEAQRFAPTLNPRQFGTKDRQQLLDHLQPFDLLLCSYGLLQQEEIAQMLAKIEWQTIVLDEAQAIKNFATKRSQAAMNLQAGFKLITTGTPIENHLGELWNLFRFINPGLLGSLEHFNQRFATPIEKYQDKQARSQLKKLIQPFLLRRTKNQVLHELPSRTEILLQVELSREEMAFYEALRRQALAKLEASSANARAKHLQVLAEITRLRRACCHPCLVMPDTSLPSSKLQLFGETLEELLDNRHKALVFSQFVDHLTIIRHYLDQQKISYQYLEGSTPANERKKRVDAFQAGQGDVFLISLKAGGTGLNLTAADYVIHMDPWWNPAVEDQASDRAHRIGQKRPVTIYRLVAKETIEEKILELHGHKRDLADSLLEGTDVSGKISLKELLRLIGD
jgi:superfamily II DNA or RNA helicase